MKVSFNTPAQLETQLETAYLVKDYHDALENNKPLPKEPFPDLQAALLANRISHAYTQKANLSIKEGLRLVSSALTDNQVVFTWLLVSKKQQASNSPSLFPLAAIGKHELLTRQNPFL